MSGNKTYNDLIDEELESLYPIRNSSPRLVHRESNKQKKGNLPSSTELALKLADQVEDLSSSQFSYKASRHEQGWMADSLREFIEQKWLDDVLRLVKGGKEANVYQCLVNPSVTELEKPFLAAKIYRPRRFPQPEERPALPGREIQPG